MSFDLSQFHKPLLKVALSTGPLFLYALRTPDIRMLSKLPKDSSTTVKFENLIVVSASRHEYDNEKCKDPPRMTLAEVAAFQCEDQEKISKAILDPQNFNAFWSATKDALLRLPAANIGEQDVDRLVALVDCLTNEEAKRTSATI